MLKDNKGILTLEGFTRLVIAIFALSTGGYLLYKFGGATLEASGFNVKLSEQTFNELAQYLNSEDFGIGSKQRFLNFDKDTAIIGFSKNLNYECHKCYTTKLCPSCPPPSLLPEIVARFSRPNTAECKDSACLCLCQKDMQTNKISDVEYEILCTELKCQKLNHDIYPQVNVKYSTFDPALVVVGVSWKGGFLVARQLSKVEDDVLVSAVPENQQTRVMVWLEKKIVDGKANVALCHELPCIEERK